MLRKYVPTGQPQRKLAARTELPDHRCKPPRHNPKIKEIFVAHPDDPVIEAEFTSMTPPASHHAESAPSPSNPHIRITGTPHQSHHDSRVHNSDSQSATGTERAFPDGFVAAYEKHEDRRQPSRSWGFSVTPLDDGRYIVSIYGTRWILTGVFLAFVLIGFSIDRAPGFLLNLMEILPW